MLHFFEGGAMAGEELIVLGPSLDRAGFSTVRPDFQNMLGARFEQLLVMLAFESRFPGHVAEGFVTTCQGALGRFDAHFMHLFPSLMSRFLHDNSQ